MAITSIGPIVQGEIPLPLVNTFVNPDGSPAWTAAVGWTAKWTMEDPSGTITTTDATVGANGVVTVDWDGTSFTGFGVYQADLWVGNGGQFRFASQYNITVQPSISVPNI